MKKILLLITTLSICISSINADITVIKECEGLISVTITPVPPTKPDITPIDYQSQTISIEIPGKFEIIVQTSDNTFHAFVPANHIDNGTLTIKKGTCTFTCQNGDQIELTPLRAYYNVPVDNDVILMHPHHEPHIKK
jgi:hypothetical protein